MMPAAVVNDDNTIAALMHHVVMHNHTMVVVIYVVVVVDDVVMDHNVAAVNHNMPLGFGYIGPVINNVVVAMNVGVGCRRNVNIGNCPYNGRLHVSRRQIGRRNVTSGAT